MSYPQLCKHFDSKGCFYCGEEHGYRQALQDVRREIGDITPAWPTDHELLAEMLARLEKLEQKQGL